MNVFAIILAGGRGSGLSVLTAQRSKPALPFGGKYRMIDFVLSNLCHSNIRQAAVLTQFQPQSLAAHLGTGAAWGFDSLQTWQASKERTGMEMYRGTADAVYQNRSYIAEMGCELVLILSGDHIYRQDYREMIRFHQEKGARLTIAVMQVPIEEAHRYGLMEVDPTQRVTSFIEKPHQPAGTLASLGMYVFNTRDLLHLLEENAKGPTPGYDFGRNIIPEMVAGGQVYAYQVGGYWADIGTIESYWKGSLDLLAEPPAVTLHDPEWLYYTRAAERPPVEVRQTGGIAGSLVSEGCMISGQVIHSVLSPGVRVEAGAIVRDSVILHDTIIRAGAVVDRCVIDENVIVGANAQVGSGEDQTHNSEEPAIFSTGISVVGARAVLPDGIVIGRNCRVDPDVGPGDFQGHKIASGSTIGHP